MLIAIDYDDTFTADPEFWRLVIEAGQQRGHRFVIVSSRELSPENYDEIDRAASAVPCQIRLSSGFPKRTCFPDETPDVWIDDLPESVGMPALAALNQVHVKGK